MQGIKEEQSDVEPEDLGVAETSQLFDLDKIKVDQRNVNIGYLVNMLEDGDIDLYPEYQLTMERWDVGQKSRLIESLLIGLPLPSFYFSADEKTGKWLVIDGMQRLCTIKDFILNTLYNQNQAMRLTGLEILRMLEGKAYTDLSNEEKRKINGAKANLYVIEMQTPPNIKFLIFKRLNTGGRILTNQEIRHALYQGIASEFIGELASTTEFVNATGGSIQSKSMDDRNLVNRFIAFYLLGYDENYTGDLELFLNEGLEKLNKLRDVERVNLKILFTKAMQLAFELFGKNTFRKIYNNSGSRKPISKAIFDTVSVNLAWLSDSEQEILKLKKESLYEGLLSLFNFDIGFHNSITTGTGQRTSVKYRFAAVRELFRKIIEQ